MLIFSKYVVALLSGGIFVLLVSCKPKADSVASESDTLLIDKTAWVNFNAQFTTKALPWSLKTDTALTFGSSMDTVLSNAYLGTDSGVVYYPVARFIWNSNLGFIYGKSSGETKNLALLTCDSSGLVLDQLDFFQDYLLDNPDARPMVSILLDEKGNLRIDQYLNNNQENPGEPLQSFVYQIGSEGNIEDQNHVDQTLSDVEEEMIPVHKP